MIRIRPGRSWRLNPGYLDELRALSPPGARSFDGGGILDVVGIEVDGVDIAAGVGEAEVLVAVDELLAALRHLGEGSAAAQATVGRGPTELVLEARGPDVLLSLVTLAPPARMLASGLLLDSGRLWSAAAAAARSLAADLVRISPALVHSPLLRRLRGAAPRPPAGRTRALAWPHAEGRSFLARSGRGAVRCEVQVPAAAAARLEDRTEVPQAQLAPLLGSGAVALRFAGAPALQSEGPVYLALRNLVREAEALVRAWEAGEPAFQLRFASIELTCDLTRDEVRAPGWRAPAAVAPAALALALAGAARAYAEKAQKLAGRPVESDDPLRDLRATAPSWRPASCAARPRWSPRRLRRKPCGRRSHRSRTGASGGWSTARAGALRPRSGPERSGPLPAWWSRSGCTTRSAATPPRAARCSRSRAASPCGRGTATTCSSPGPTRSRGSIPSPALRAGGAACRPQPSCGPCLEE